MNGAELTRHGLDGLDRLRAPHGFDASDASGLYPALYGRDSLWVLLLLADSLDIRPDDEVRTLLADTGPQVLGSLARLQGTRVDDRVEEQPGRIPHEYHPGGGSAHSLDMGLPLAQGRSYGGFDETFLFVLGYHAYVARHPGHSLEQELWPHVERAVAWVWEHADADGDGLFEYRRRNPDNLLNQVWKDSFDAATHTGFDVPPQPLAWLEVQAYGRACLLAAARSLRSRGRDDEAARAEASAHGLDARVDATFWLGPEEGFAMAVDGRKRPVRGVASNAGHALWAGAVRADRVAPLVARMMRPDLLSPYGLRTLSSSSPYYAPFAYHRGAVWPFDNAVFAMGLVRAGHLAEAVTVARSVAAATEETGSAVECYAVLDPELTVGPAPPTAGLYWRHVPVRNTVQAFSAAGLVALGAVLERFG